MSPSVAQEDGINLLRQDVVKQSEVLTAHNNEIAALKQAIAVMESENKHRDEKLNSILSLGRSVLVAVITLAISLVGGFLAAGGFRVK